MSGESAGRRMAAGLVRGPDRCHNPNRSGKRGPVVKLDEDHLLRIYELIVGEMHYYLDAHQARVAFYSKVVLTLIGATIAGVLVASQWYHFAALCAGPILTYAVSNIARDGCFRFYQRFLEAVTYRAKIEQDLGLTHPRPDAEADADAFWATEPLIAPRHVTSSKRYRSSEDFITSNMRRGFHLWTDRLFRGLEVLSGVSFVGLLFLAIVKATGSLTAP